MDAEELDVHTVSFSFDIQFMRLANAGVRFNGGPRICIGQQFALTEMSYTIVRILQRFERIEKYWDEKKQKLKAEIVLSPATGVQVGLWEAKSG